MKKMKTILNDDSGVTLVELLAAITILSIIVTAFLAFFIQAGRTNNVTNEINEATFIAQEAIEHVTHLSESGANVNEVSLLEDEHVKPKINKDEDTGLYQIIIEVREGGKLHAKMETWLPFTEEDAAS